MDKRLVIYLCLILKTGEKEWRYEVCLLVDGNFEFMVSRHIGKYKYISYEVLCRLRETMDAEYFGHFLKLQDHLYTYLKNKKKSLEGFIVQNFQFNYIFEIQL